MPSSSLALSSAVAIARRNLSEQEAGAERNSSKGQKVEGLGVRERDTTRLQGQWGTQNLLRSEVVRVTLNQTPKQPRQNALDPSRHREWLKFGVRHGVLGP